MVLAGIDVAGFDDKRGQRKVIALVIGTNAAINTLWNSIGLKKIHMRDLKKPKRNIVKKRLIFKSADILGISLIVGKNRIVHEIHENHKKGDRFASIGAIYDYFDYVLLEKIQPKIEHFLSRYSLHLKDIQFQTDADMKDTLRLWKLTAIKEGKAHELADGLAFLCKNGHNVSGCLKLDLEAELEAKLKAELIR